MTAGTGRQQAAKTSNVIKKTDWAVIIADWYAAAAAEAIPLFSLARCPWLIDSLLKSLTCIIIRHHLSQGKKKGYKVPRLPVNHRWFTETYGRVRVMFKFFSFRKKKYGGADCYPPASLSLDGLWESQVKCWLNSFISWCSLHSRWERTEKGDGCDEWEAKGNGEKMMLSLFARSSAEFPWTYNKIPFFSMHVQQ